MMKKLFAVILTLALLASLAACGSNAQQATVQTLPTIETAPQKEYTTQNIVDMFNQAVEKVEQAQSYQMDGSVSSTAVMGDMMATVVTSIDCDYAVKNGKPNMLMKSLVNTGSSQTEHVTYYEDGKYYFEVMNLKYYTTTNDYSDYHAEHYLKQVEAKDLSDLEIRDELDGSCSIQFSIPYGVYQSEAIAGWLGGFTSEEVDEHLITIKAVIGADGTCSNFYMSFATGMELGQETVEQTVILSMVMSGYNATQVVAPADLDSYENWDADTGTQSGGQNPDGDDQGFIDGN